MWMSWFIQTPTGTLIWNETSQDAHSSHLMISHRAYLHIAAFCDITTAKANTPATINKCYIVQSEFSVSVWYVTLGHYSFITALFSRSHRKGMFLGPATSVETHTDSLQISTQTVRVQDHTRKPGAVKVATWSAAFTSAFNREGTASWIFVRWSRKCCSTNPW